MSKTNQCDLWLLNKSYFLHAFFTVNGACCRQGSNLAGLIISLKAHNPTSSKLMKNKVMKDAFIKLDPERLLQLTLSNLRRLMQPLPHRVAA